MTYFAYIKNFEDNDEMNIQHELIKKYTATLNIDIIRTYKAEAIDSKKIDKHFEQIITKLDHRNGLIISSMSSLGNSAYKILNRILQLKERNITLHCAEDNFILPLDNEDIFKLLKAVVSTDRIYKDKRVELAKTSREKSGKKIGRKTGTKTKSIFDKHKKHILKLFELKVPNTKILEDIKKDDENLKSATPQALGQYIKKIKAIQSEKKENIKVKNAETFNNAVTESLTRKSTNRSK